MMAASRDGAVKIESFRIACGKFISAADVAKEELEKPGWGLMPATIRKQGGVHAARVTGTSMTPLIEHNNWVFFTAESGGTRNERIVIVEDLSKIGDEGYTLKKYRSKQVRDGDSWRHEEITLWPLNALEHEPIHLKEDDDRYKVRGWYIGQAKEITRADDYVYESIDD